MKKVFIILFALYYLLGNLIFQGGDFSQINTLSDTFKHCKETEDKNLTVFDFLTEHLIDLDCFFDEHDIDSNEKPHKPIQTQQSLIAFKIINKLTPFEPKPHFEFIEILKHIGVYNSNYSFQTITSIFHPPATI